MYKESNLSKLRARMKEDGLKAYTIVTGDPHDSEEPAGFYGAERKYFCPFTGDNAIVLITQDEALVWTDGRFFISAEQELAGTSFKLMKVATPGYPSFEEYVQTNNLYPLGTNFLMVSPEAINGFKGKNGIVVDCDYSSLVEDRPVLSESSLWRFDDPKYNDATSEEKIAIVLQSMKEYGAKAHLVTTLDDIAWLTNLRGDDVNCTPVFYSYLYMSYEEGVHLFVNPKRITFDLPDITIHPYEEIDEFLKERADIPTLVDPDKCNAHIYDILKKPVNHRAPSNLLKAVKGKKEIENIISIQEEDGVALLKFMLFLKKNKDNKELTEWDYAEVLQGFRGENPRYIGDSFTTIAAYGPNAAMMHYAPTEEVNAKVDGTCIELLVDSGGQYLGGTTDTTRTFAIGELTDEYIHDYTLTLKSVIALSRAIFLHGTSGVCLDYAAREIMWREGMDYKCGTGHGVSYVGPVHEGPNGFRYRTMPGKDDGAINVPGMVTTVEPGVYKAGKYGIRIENNLLTVPAFETSDGQFYKFQTITYVPIETRALDLSLLSQEEIDWLNAYHKDVYERLSKRVDGELLAYLEEVTKPIQK